MLKHMCKEAPMCMTVHMVHILAEKARTVTKESVIKELFEKMEMKRSSKDFAQKLHRRFWKRNSL